MAVPVVHETTALFLNDWHKNKEKYCSISLGAIPVATCFKVFEVILDEVS